MASKAYRGVLRKIQILTVLEQRARVMGKMEQARLAKAAKKELKRKHNK